MKNEERIDYVKYSALKLHFIKELQENIKTVNPITPLKDIKVGNHTTGDLE